MAPMERDIEASTKRRALLDRARDVIVADPGCVVADVCSPEDRNQRCFHTILGVEGTAGGGLAEARRSQHSSGGTITWPVRPSITVMFVS